MLEDVRSVPQVPRVEDDPDRVVPRLLEQRLRPREIGDHREVVLRREVNRLERDPDACGASGLAEPAKRLHDDGPRLRLVPVAGDAGQDQHDLRLEGGEPFDRRNERLHPRLGLGRLGRHSDREDRQRRGQADRGLEAALAELPDRLRVVCGRKLALGDTDAPGATRGERGEVLFVGVVRCRELGDGETRRRHRATGAASCA